MQVIIYLSPGASYGSNFPTYRASSSYYKDSTLASAYDMFMLKFNSSGELDNGPALL